MTRTRLDAEAGAQGSSETPPTGFEVDDTGNMVVMDSRNHRPQVFNSELEFVGFISSNAQFSRPISIHFDFKSKVSKAISKIEF